MSQLDTPFSYANHPSLQSPGDHFEAGKRGLDMIAAGIGLVLMLPLLVGCGLWIWFADGGPIFYRQWRVGRQGRLFVIWKLRTMRQDAERLGACYASNRDPRVIRGCQWMRRSHIDELPQLLNILAGHMSLVGPRPERPEILENVREALPAVDRRLAAAPGLTGLAQVRNGYTNDLAGMRRKLALDLRYLRNRSFLGDLKLILATLPKVWDTAAC